MRIDQEMEYRPGLRIPRWCKMVLVAAWVYVVLVAGSLLLVGCTANIRMTDIEFDAGRDMRVDASGAQNTTDTGQLAAGDTQALIDAAKTALAGKTSSIIDKIKSVIGGSDAPAAVSPAGTVEEVE